MNPKKIKSVIPGQLNAVQVVDNDISTAIRLWKRMLKDNKVVEDCFSRKYFEKPSIRRRNEILSAKYIQSKQ